MGYNNWEMTEWERYLKINKKSMFELIPIACIKDMKLNFARQP